MKFAKMSDYIRKAVTNNYGFVTNPSSITENLHIRAKMRLGIINLLTCVGEEWLPAPMDLADNVLDGAKIWVNYLDEGDQAKFYANPGHNYDYYVVEDEEKVIGVFAVLYNKHWALESINSEPILQEVLHQYADKLAFCSTYYVQREYRDGKIDKGLIEFAGADLAAKGYTHLLIDEMLDRPDLNKTDLYVLKFLLDDGWTEIGKVFPDQRRTSAEALSQMKSERRAVECGTVWLLKKTQ